MMLDVIVSGGGVSVVAALVAARDRLRAAEGDVWSRIVAQGAPVHEATETVADMGSGTVAVPVAMPVPRRAVDSASTASAVDGRGPVAVVSTAAAVDGESSTTAISASAASNTAVDSRMLQRLPQNRRTGLRAAAAAPAGCDGDDADADGWSARSYRGTIIAAPRCLENSAGDRSKPILVGTRVYARTRIRVRAMIALPAGCSRPGK
jgi:hypothetical protein